MKICHYDREGQAGVVAGDTVYSLSDALAKAGHLKPGSTMVDVVRVLAAEPAAMALARDTARLGAGVPLASVTLLPPLTNPPAIWAAAANYKAHQAEMQAAHDTDDRSQRSKDDLMAEFFLKPVSSLIGPNGTVVLPTISKHVDFECELCAVIGTPARKVTEAQALEHVFGYTMLWDFSQRDPWLRIHNTRNIRKGFDTFTGLGPWIVTRDEIPEPQDLMIRVQQNGKDVMTAHTADMICGLREHIRFLSNVLTLHPGVLITTGTPAGVSRLADGDRLEGTIDRIGTMKVSVAADT